MYYSGIKDGNYVIGELNLNGSIIWEKITNFMVNDFCFYTNDYTNQNYIILVGNDNNYITGIIAIYDKSGNFISDKVWNNYSTVFFNAVSTSTLPNAFIPLFVAAGGAGNTTICPYITNFYISETGQIIKEFPDYTFSKHDELLTEYPNFRFGQLIQTSCINYDKRIRNHVTYSALMYYKQGGEIKYFSVAKFGLKIYTQYSWFDGEILWMTDIKNDDTNLCTIRGNIYLHNDNVYVVGKSDGEKIENSENDYWYNCIAAKISDAGELLWKKEYNISNYSDGFTDCIYSDNYLYAVGFVANYCNNDTNNFSYGLISKISSSTGNLISEKLIGNNTYGSGLNTLLLHNEKLYLGGYTKGKQCNENSTFQSWFVEFNQNGM